jgi:hypothetical protein
LTLLVGWEGMEGGGGKLIPVMHDRGRMFGSAKPPSKTMQPSCKLPMGSYIYLSMV